MALVLGISFGARSTRAEVRDAATGTLRSAGEVRHRDLGADVDDPTVWWRSLGTAVTQTGEREIAAISVCGSHPGLVLLDGAGAVLRPVQPWDDDASARDAARLTRTLGAERWANRTGALPAAGTAVSRLAWLRRCERETFGRIGAALLPHDWLTYRLAGRAVTDRGGASLTGAWSPAAEGWLAEVLEELAPGGTSDWWRERLPAVLGPAQSADWLDAPVYELLGLRGRPLVGPGTGETMAIALALGVTPGRAAVVLGGATTVLVGTDAPVVDETGRAQSRADATGGHLAVETTAGGAGLMETVARLLGVDEGSLGSLALDASPTAGSPLVVPSVPGRAGAVLTGLGPNAGPEEVARATLDGAACAVLEGLDHVEKVGATWDGDEPLRLAAPGAWLDAQARVLADLADRPVLPTPIGSLAAAGACIQAAAVLQEREPADVAAEWSIDGADIVEPVDDPTRDERRAAFTLELARQRRALRPQR